MAMEQLYGGYASSYNELQEWIAAMREYVPGTVIELQTRPYYGPDDQLQPVDRTCNDNIYIISDSGKGLIATIRRSGVLWRDAMVANRRMARLMNAEIYLRRLETFRVTETISRRPGIPIRSYGVDLWNKRSECNRFETLHYPCAHVVTMCAKVNLNVEQYVDDAYMLERTLRVWKNEFPILLDLSTWEVHPMTFKHFLDRGLRRNPRGRP
ncbi:hypothetical protein GOBAR_DD09465 [Gossypium barbadense]|nr:hypothetical protein GOBAR_DD09465 [Gossypium barbadense]